jgi:minor extracellular serine protease Vpr
MAMRNLLLLLIFLVFIQAQGQRLWGPETQHVFQLIQIALAQPEAKEADVEAQFPNLPIYQVQGQWCLSSLAQITPEFDRHSVEERFFVGSIIGEVATLKIPLANLKYLEELKGLRFLQISPRISPDLNRATIDVRADSIWQGIHLPQSYTGKGVLIGITDWGYDYGHPTFMDTSLTHTRIRAVWDHFKQSGPPPIGFNYGTTLDNIQDILNAQSDTFGVYEYATHGNHVAGIAAGSGGGTPHRGVAFEADLLLNSIQLDAASAIDAFHWMKQISDADNKRLVINMSWGLYYMGPLDGTSLVSRTIDTLSAQGVIFTTSAGNNGNVNFHISKTFNSDSLRSRIQFFPYNQHDHMWGQCISAWGQPGKPFSVGFEVYDAGGNLLDNLSPVLTQGPASYLDTIMILGQDTIFYNVLQDMHHPLNGRPHVQLRIKNTHTNLRIVLKAHADSGIVHFWNVVELDNGVGNWGQAFSAFGPNGVSGDNLFGIGEPAVTESVISVASHIPDIITASGFPLIGDRNNFSSIGPVYDGRMKPDISAPGGGIISAISSYTNANFTPVTAVNLNGRTYPFAAFSGTSMASPMVAGVAALLLEANPMLSAFQVKALIMRHAREDLRTGVIPAGGSPLWGMGKVNAYAAVLDALNEVSLSKPHASLNAILYPNPAVNQVTIQVEDAKHRTIPYEVVNQLGQMVSSGILEGDTTFDVSNWPSGMFFWKLGNSNELTVLRMVR